MALNTYQNFMNSLRGLFGMGAKPEQAHYGGRVAPYDPEADLNRVSRENAMTDISRSMGPGIDADAVGKLAGTDPAQATALMQFFFGGQRAQDLAREQMAQQANKNALDAWMGMEGIKSGDWRQYMKTANDIPLQREQLRAQANRERDMMKWMGLGQLKDKDIAGKKEITGMTEMGKTGRTEMTTGSQRDIAEGRNLTAKEIAEGRNETSLGVQELRNQGGLERAQLAVDAAMERALLSGNQRLEQIARQAQATIDLEKERQFGRKEITGMQGEQKLQQIDKKTEGQISVENVKQPGREKIQQMRGDQATQLEQVKQPGREKIQGMKGEQAFQQIGKKTEGQQQLQKDKLAQQAEEAEKNRDLGYYRVDTQAETARNKPLPQLSGAQYDRGADAVAAMLKQEGIKKVVPQNFEGALVRALQAYAHANEGKAPATLMQIEPHIDEQSRAAWEKWKAEQLTPKKGWLW